VKVIKAPHQYHEDDLYIDMTAILGRSLMLKCEGFNFAGSVKLKAAVAMVEDAEKKGLITPDTVFVESSSGNLGIALAMVSASKGYRFLCVTDPRCNRSAVRMIEALGGEVRVIRKFDDNQGFIGSRIAYIRRLCEVDERYVWLNQYANSSNWLAHYESTGPAIARSFPQLDVLFIGAGTTGTLMGCARYFREHGHSETRIVAVDSVGSVTFGSEPRTRVIPGLGASIRPPLLDEDYVDDVVHVPETDALRTCHQLAVAGFLMGGSTGTVTAGAMAWLGTHDPEERLTAVAIAPDLGERYLESIFHSKWVRDNFDMSENEPRLTSS
jgi:N-(2-amino-2-carboxyethyl)-L-glutamate synthase